MFLKKPPALWPWAQARWSLKVKLNRQSSSTFSNLKTLWKINWLELFFSHKNAHGFCCLNIWSLWAPSSTWAQSAIAARRMLSSQRKVLTWKIHKVWRMCGSWYLFSIYYRLLYCALFYEILFWLRRFFRFSFRFPGGGRSTSAAPAAFAAAAAGPGAPAAVEPNTKWFRLKKRNWELKIYFIFLKK